MGAFIARQPNGLLCRFSSVVDCITDYNMTEDEYIEMCAEKATKRSTKMFLTTICNRLNWWTSDSTQTT